MGRRSPAKASRPRSVRPVTPPFRLILPDAHPAPHPSPDAPAAAIPCGDARPQRTECRYKANVRG